MAERTYQPLGDRVLIKRAQAAKQTQSGLWIPGAEQVKLFEGTVVAIGEDEVIKVKVGDQVLFDKHTEDVVNQGGDEHLLIQFRDILAVIHTS
jgi:chaperonin GroES